MKDTNSKSDTPSYTRHFKIPNELLDSMEEQRLENVLSMPKRDLTMYEDKTTITYIALPIYQVHTFEPMLLCVDTGASHSRIGTRSLKELSVIPD